MRYLSPLSLDHSSHRIGRKSYALARIKQAGFLIPNSICLSGKAYQDFLNENNLMSIIDVELGRKSIEDMRWEELWDCGLRIRNMILQSTLSDNLIKELSDNIPRNWIDVGIAIRSSSPQEDMKSASFAGLYDSYTDCNDFSDIIESVLKVWASLWSDKALLYRKEISLDIKKSSMAILIQKMIRGEYSGVGFSRDPNDKNSEYLEIEFVPGLCQNLVDGTVEPYHYKISRKNLKLHHKSQKLLAKEANPDIFKNLLIDVATHLIEIEAIFKCPIDVEWTYTNARVTILQVRPISYAIDLNKKRLWYLSLTPNYTKLKKLADQVKNKLIPELIDEGSKIEAEDFSSLSNVELAEALNSSIDTLHKWRHIYKEKFIPFAHGVREFGQYYNDSVKPEDPYEFTHLLKSEARIASRRLQALQNCHQNIAANASVYQFLRSWVSHGKHKLALTDIEKLRSMHNGDSIILSYYALKNKYFDITLGGKRWIDRDDLILNLLLNFSKAKISSKKNDDTTALFNKYVAASHDITYAKTLLQIARLSWTIRDDDNLLLSKVESQCLKGMGEAKQRLVDSGKLDESIEIGEEEVAIIISALKEGKLDTSKLLKTKKNEKKPLSKLTPRHLKGQPAVPGKASGFACRISNLDDIKSFNPGDIIICDAVDPNMTHLVPLARGLVERRGGMLIHGVIIARELGIPCVNGVGILIEKVANGDYITIDGNLGLVIVGEADFPLS